MQQGSAQATAGVAAMAASMQAESSKLTQTFAINSVKQVASLDAAAKAAQAMAAQVTASGQAVTAASAPINTMRQSLGSLSQEVIRQTSAQGNLSKSIVGTGQAVAPQLNQFQQLQQRYQQTTSAASKLTSITEDVVKSQSRLASGFSSVLSAATPLVGLFLGGFGLARLSQSFLQNALAMDSVRSTLVAVSGSTGIASKEMQFLQGVAQQTGTAVGTLAQQWSGLFAAANPVPGRLEEARKTFVALVDAAARMGKSTEQVGGALYGLTQLVGGTTVQMQELQQQIGDALPGVLPALSRELGITDQELRKLIASGELLVVDTLPALTRAFGSMAAGDGAVATARAEFGRLGTSWTNLMDAFAQLGVLALVTKSVQGVTFVISTLTAGVEGLRAALRTLPAESAEGLTQRLEAIRTQQALLARHADLVSRQDAGEPRARAEIKLLEDRNKLNAEAIRLQQQLDKLIEPQASVQGPSAAESALEKERKFLADLSKTPAAIKKEIGEIDRQLAALRSGNITLLKAYGLDPTAADFQQTLNAATTKLIESRQKLTDDLLGIDRKAAGVAGNVAAERAKADESVIAASLKRQEALISQSYDDRRQQIDTQFSRDLTAEPLRVEELGQIRKTAIGALAVEEAKLVEQARLDSNTRQLDATLRTLDAEIKAHANKPAQIAKFEAEKVAARENSAAQIEQIIAKTADVEVKAGKQTLDEQIHNAQELVKLHEDVNKQIEKQNEDILRNRTRDVERQLEQEQRAYERFVDRTTAKVADIFEGLLKGTLSLVDTFKEMFLKTIAQLAAEVATKAIIIPIIGAIVGTGSSALGGLGELLGGGSTGADASGDSGGLMGILEQMLGLGSSAASGTSLVSKLTDAIGLTDAASGVTLTGRFAEMLGLDAATSLTDIITLEFGKMTQAVVGGVDTLFSTGPSSVANQALLASEESIGSAASGAGLGASSSQVLGAIGGLAGVAAGIYAAINANNDAAKAAYAASAAASAAAATSAILVSAGVIAAGSGWTGIGAIVAAVVAAIGLILDQVISPAGPSLGIQLGTGLSVDTQDNQLHLAGDLGSTVTRHTNLPADQSGITTSLESAVTGMVDVMVKSINAVAVDAPKLLGPVQEALNTGLHDAVSINSASFDHMKTDVEAFLQFIPLQVATQFLDPLMQAFAQVEDLGLKEKIMKLPQAAGQLAGVFFGLQQALDKLTDTPNTDVLRRISDIQTPLNEFFDAIFRQVDNLTKDIFSELNASPLDQQLKLLPQAIASVSAVIQTFTDGLNSMSGQTYGDRDHLRVEIEELRKQLSDAAVQTADDIVQGVFAQTAITLPKLLNESIEVEFLTISSFFTQQLQALQTLKFAQVQLGEVQAHPEDLSGQINALVKSILDNATMIVEDAFAEGPEKLSQTIAIIQSIPDAVASLNPAFMQMKFMAAAFAPVANGFSTAIDGLQKEIDPASVDLEHATERVKSLGDSLRANNMNIAVALPLFEALRVAVLAQLEAQIAAVQAEHQAKLDAITDQQQLVQDQIDAINELARAPLAFIDAWRDAINGARDAVQVQIDAINELADAQLEAIDAQREAINTQRDATQVQIDLINEQADVQLEAIDAQRSVIEGQRDVLSGQREIVQEQLRGTKEVVDTLTSWLKQVESMRTQVDQAARANLAPAAQRGAIEDELATLSASLPTLTGDAYLDALQKMVDLNEELLDLGEESNQLDVQAEALKNLEELSKIMAGIQDTLNPQLTDAAKALEISQLQLDSLDAQLKSADDQLKALDAQTKAVVDARDALLVPLNASMKSMDDQLKALDAQTKAVTDERDALLVPLNASMKLLDDQIKWLDLQTKTINDQTTALLNPLNAQMDALNAQLKEAQDTKELNRQIALLQGEAVAELKRMQESLQNLFLYGQIDSVTQGSSLNELLHIGKNTEPLLTIPLPVAVSSLPPTTTTVAPTDTVAPPAANEPYNPYNDPKNYSGDIYDPLNLLKLRMQGGLIGYASGGMVPTMLEPREGYFLPPMTQAQQGALMGMNAAFPRFGFGGVVPGLGSGDTVPAMMPPGTVIMNRRAMSAMGYQQGGVSNWFSSSTSGGLNSVGSSTSGGQQSVSSSTREGDVHLHFEQGSITINGSNKTTREQARELMDELKRQVSRETKSQFGNQRRLGS